METRDSKLTFYDLKNLVQSGEHQFLEFKRVIASPEKIAREICAFANASGGTILIGVDDNKTIVGLEHHEEELFDLEKAAQELCEPPVDMDVELLPFGCREVVIVYVKQAESKPVCLLDGDQKKAFVRRGHESMLLSREEKAVMKKKHRPEGVTFRYGEYEQKLFRYLAEFGSISVPDFAALVGIPSKKSLELLTNLAAADILDLQTVDGNSRFSQKVHATAAGKKK